TRRMIIGFGLAAPTLAVPWLAGCASSGSGVESPPGPPSPAAASSPAANQSATPVPSNPTTGPAATEQALAALAAAILVGPHRNQLSKDRRQLLTFLRNAHTAHAQAITSPLPAPAPLRITGSSLNGSLALLSRREASAAEHYRRAALKAKGSDALLWGSLSVAAASFTPVIGSNNPPAARPVADRQPVEILPEDAAVQELVRQLHALVYGYQLAIGKFKVLSKQRRRAERELLAHRVFRDRLIAWLSRHSAEIPAPEPAYVPSVVPRNPATAGRLIMRMQTALQPFCGLWLAASATQPDRQLALNALTTAMKTARSWGAPLQAWPGWSS
ncbi:MAG TPA: DUF4439 domain-containing protein, partial [Propionibacteriaceae bacterium]|nr:DUF4439 domain-containing protein [Propionibacteriaceae bacterium]